MAKKKIADIATENDLNPKELLKQLQEAGFSVSSPTSTIDDGLAKKVLGIGKPSAAAGNGASTKAKEAPAPPRQPRKAQPAGSQLRAQPRQGGATAPRTPPREAQPQRPQRSDSQRGGERSGRG